MLAKVKKSFKTLARAVWYEYYPLVFIGLFLLALITMQWIFEFDQLYEVIVINDAGLSFVEKIDFMLEAVRSLFRYADDLTPIAIILIAFFQAGIGTIWIRSRSIKKSKKAAAAAMSLGVLGAGCVACSSSLLSVVLSSIGTTLSVALVQAIGDILLIIAVMLSVKAFVDLGIKTAGLFDE